MKIQSVLEWSRMFNHDFEMICTPTNRNPDTDYIIIIIISTNFLYILKVGNMMGTD